MPDSVTLFTRDDHVFRVASARRVAIIRFVYSQACREAREPRRACIKQHFNAFLRCSLTSFYGPNPR